MRVFRETQVLFLRNLRKSLSFPMWLFLGLMQPVLYLLLYMPLLRNLGTQQLPLGQIAQIFVPGMLVIMGVSSLFAGFGFIPEIREGYVTRLLVTPVSRVSILLALLLNGLLVLLMQVVLLLVIATFLGLSISFLSAVLALIMVALIGSTMASFSYIVSLTTRSEDALAPLVNTLYLPIMLLSGIMLPISLAPDWLKTAALFNPFYYAVEAIRALFLNNYSDAVVLEGFGVMIVFAAAAIYLTVRVLKKSAA